MVDDDYVNLRLVRSAFAAPELRDRAALALADRVDELNAQLEAAEIKLAAYEQAAAYRAGIDDHPNFSRGED